MFFVELPAVSRVHARIFLRSDKAFIEDRESRNNTYLNRKEIKGKGECPLKDGDRIGICESLFVYRSGEPLPESSIARKKNPARRLSTRLMPQATRMCLPNRTRRASLRRFLRSAGTECDARSQSVVPQNPGRAVSDFPAGRPWPDHSDRRQRRTHSEAAKHRRQDQDTIRFSKTVVNQAINQKKALLSSNTSADERFQMSQSIADFKIARWSACRS